MATATVIVAAGRGVRMGPGVDKLFLEVAGRPLVAHTWRLFEELNEVQEIVLVIREGQQDRFETLARRFNYQKPFRFAGGGEHRQDSVWNGLQALGADVDLVAIQDGARPCTSPAAIRDTIAAAREVGAAVLAQRVVDTLKEADDSLRVRRTVDRSRLWAVQTPQAFRAEVIRKALARVREAGVLVTDDTAACEQMGLPVQLVRSEAPNPKVTAPGDLEWVRFLLTRSTLARGGGDG